MSKRVRQPAVPSERIFGFVQKFNRVAMLDEDFARQLPAHEFELRFDEAGNIYVDGKPLGMNINKRYRFRSPE